MAQAWSMHCWCCLEMQHVETQRHNYNYWKQPVAQFFYIHGRLIVGWATSEGSNFLAKLFEQQRRYISWSRQKARATHPIASTVLIETAVNSKCLHPRKRVFLLPPAVAVPLAQVPGASSFVVGCDLMNPFWLNKWKRVYYWKSTLNTFSTKRSFQNDLQHGSIFILRTLWIGPSWPPKMHLSTPEVATVDGSKSTRAQAILLDEPKLHTKTPTTGLTR